MQRWEESERRREEERISERRKSEKEEDAGARKRRKVAIYRVFPMIYGSGGSKSRLAKAAVRSHVVRCDTKIAHRCGAKRVWK